MRIIECVICETKINAEEETYIVGESLGEYWCIECAELDLEVQND